MKGYIGAGLLMVAAIGLLSTAAMGQATKATRRHRLLPNAQGTTQAQPASERASGLTN